VEQDDRWGTKGEEEEVNLVVDNMKWDQRKEEWGWEGEKLWSLSE